MKTASVICILFLTFLGGCSKEDTDNSVGKIGVDFLFDLKDPKNSPEIHLNYVPPGTARLDVFFFDDTNKWEHGGGSLPYNGSASIPVGAVKGFKGMDSGYGFMKMKVTIKAYNKNGQLIGKGVISKSPPDQ